MSNLTPSGDASFNAVVSVKSRPASSTKRVYWSIIFPLGIVLLGIAYVPFAWREMRADVAAMPTKPLFANVQATLPKMTIAEWDVAVAQLTRAITVQPRHPDNLTMLGRLYIVRSYGAPTQPERRLYAAKAQTLLRAALRDRPFHPETQVLLKNALDLLDANPEVVTQ